MTPSKPLSEWIQQVITIVINFLESNQNVNNFAGKRPLLWAQINRVDAEMRDKIEVFR